MTGVYVLSHRQSFAGVQFDFWGNFAKFRKISQKIDLNRTIQQRIFRFLKFRFFGSIGTNPEFAEIFRYYITEAQT